MSRRGGGRARDISQRSWDEDYDMGRTQPLHGAEVNKKDKRRRELVEKVERIRAENLERREALFHDQLTKLHETHLGLLNHPVVTQPNYLLRLYELSIKRDTMLISSQDQSKYGQETAQKLYDTEIERILEESELSQRGVKERLLEACEERSKKLREEKESVEVNFESLFDPQPRPHQTRRRGQNIGRELNSPMLNPPAQTNGHITVPLPHQTNGTTVVGDENSLGLGTSSTAPVNANLLLEPFPHSLLPSSPLLNAFPLPNGTASNISPMQAQAALLSALATLPSNLRSTRKRAGMNGPGLPSQSQQHNIVPGRYEFLGRPLQGIHALKSDEIQEDLDRLKKKRKRGSAAVKKLDP